MHLESSHFSATSMISLLKMGKRFHIFLCLLNILNIKHPPTSRIAHQKSLVAIWFKMIFSQTWLYKEATILTQLCVHDISHLTQGSWRESLPRPPSTLALMVVLEERESIADIIWRENEPKVIRWDQELTLQTATLCTTKNFSPTSWIF